MTRQEKNTIIGKKMIKILRGVSPMTNLLGVNWESKEVEECIRGVVTNPIMGAIGELIREIRVEREAKEEREARKEREARVEREAREELKEVKKLLEEVRGVRKEMRRQLRREMMDGPTWRNR